MQIKSRWEQYRAGYSA